jgi:ApaG protein
MPRSVHGEHVAATGRHGSEAVTRGIRVAVHPRFIPEQSGAVPGESWRGRHYVFAYTIRISNEGRQTVRLLERRWRIVDADGDEREVRGEGVVGQQPVLEPGRSFEYSSFCPLATPWGTMEGEYLMEDDKGDRFDVRIARFYLVAQ